MQIVSPYKDVEQYTRIKLNPNQLNSEIKNNMFMNLKVKVQGKCNKNGFVDEVYSIDYYSDGEMPPENLSGAVFFDIKYQCRLCRPIENTVIITQIKRIEDYIYLSNGPICIFIKPNQVDENVWDTDSGYVNKNTKEKLKINDMVKVLVQKYRINQGDFRIICSAKLLDIASPKEIEKYYGTVEEEVDNAII